MTASSTFNRLTLTIGSSASNLYLMTLPELELLVLLLSPAMLMSVLLLLTFAAGG
jgi:hypothetical protein